MVNKHTNFIIQRIQSVTYWILFSLKFLYNNRYFSLLSCSILIYAVHIKSQIDHIRPSFSPIEMHVS